MKNVIIFLTISVFLVSHPVISQKWGEVSQKALEMTSIPQDPEADAVILFDIGGIEITKDFDLVFKRHRRLKILSEEGKKHADIRLKFWHEDKIRNLDVQTLLANGKKIKLKGKHIFDEEEDQWKYKVFAFPGVEVGSVLEFRYEIFSKYINFLEPWRFQNQVFTALSQLSVILQPGFNYDVFFTNSHGIDPEPEVQEFLIPGLPIRKGQKFVWKVENLEPIKKEPYMTTINDYLMTMYFQLVSYRSRFVYHKYIRTWDDLAERISNHYKDLLSDNNGLANFVEEKTSHCTTDIDKAKTLYNFMCNSIETSGRKWIFPDIKPHDIYEERKGSPIGKNILLINLLRHSGLHADPVLLSTRSNGRLNEMHPNLQQFNHVIVQLEIADKRYFLDCSDKYSPFGVLPPSDIVDKGLLVHKESGTVIGIPEPADLNSSNITTKAVINEEGSLSCNSVLIYEGYRAMSKRKELSRKDHREYVEDILKERFPAAKIDTFKITGLDSIAFPMEIEIDYQVPNFVDLNGEMIYLQSPIIERFGSNPFKSQKRNFPVEYNYGFSLHQKTLN